MDIHFVQLALFIACLTGLIIFLAYSVRAVRRAGVGRYLRGLSFATEAIIRATSSLAMSFIGLLATSIDTGKEGDDTEADYITGVYNFRTRKFDNGTDPYGWYEEDL